MESTGGVLLPKPHLPIPMDLSKGDATRPAMPSTLLFGRDGYEIRCIHDGTARQHVKKVLRIWVIDLFLASSEWPWSIAGQPAPPAGQRLPLALAWFCRKSHLTAPRPIPSLFGIRCDCSLQGRHSRLHAHGDSSNNNNSQHGANHWPSHVNLGRATKAVLGPLSHTDTPP